MDSFWMVMIWVAIFFFMLGMLVATLGFTILGGEEHDEEPR